MPIDSIGASMELGVVLAGLVSVAFSALLWRSVRSRSGMEIVGYANATAAGLCSVLSRLSRGKPAGAAFGVSGLIFAVVGLVAMLVALRRRRMN